MDPSVETFTSEISMGEHEGRALSHARALRCRCKTLQQLNTTPLPALTTQPQLTIRYGRSPASDFVSPAFATLTTAQGAVTAGGVEHGMLKSAAKVFGLVGALFISLSGEDEYRTRES